MKFTSLFALFASAQAQEWSNVYPNAADFLFGVATDATNANVM